MQTKKPIEIIVEVKDGTLWGIVEDKGNFIPTPYGDSIDELKQNLKHLIKDYQQHEGKTDKFWSKVDTDTMDIEISYDLQAFFKEFNEIKISALAESANLNPSLLRQYATGNKYPSAEQVKKIESAVHQLGKKLKQISIYA
jgi:hypothetical protein